MDISMLVQLPDTEEAYCAWVQRYPFGFIINAWKDPVGKQDNAMMWHRADCATIDPKYSASEPPFHYVIGDRLKACSANPAALAMWAKSRTEPLTYCLVCYDTWQKEQPSVP